jgi:fructose-1-phosphate kinase PfkB-like protein
VPVSGEIRGTTVVIESDGRTTVINEPGPPLGATAWQAIVDAVGGAIAHGSFVAISGSVPPDIESGAHRTLIELSHDRGAQVAVDVTGPRRVEAARAGADIVSPNLAEAEQALGSGVIGEAVDLDDLDGAEVEERSRTAAAALVEAGAGAALVSAGSHGVAFHSVHGEGFVAAPTVTVVNPIGAGDALLGATLVACEQGRTLEAAVRDGVAYAAASVAHPVAGYAAPALVRELSGAALQ